MRGADGNAYSYRDGDRHADAGRTITPTAMPGELYEMPTLSCRASGVFAVLLMAACVLILQRHRAGLR